MILFPTQLRLVHELRYEHLKEKKIQLRDLVVM